jgi:peptidoglycan/xylan/chitin deacetylase (PgdA/CDA1 family)
MTRAASPRARLYTIELAPAARPLPPVPDRFVAPLVDVRDEDLAASGDVLAHAVDASGRRQPVAARAADGVRIAFDLDATLAAIRGESYPGAELARPIVSRLPFDYTKLPMAMITAAAGLLRRPIDLAALPPYPSYPLDFSADLVAGLAGGDLVAAPVTWPRGKKYAVAVTHDVDTAWVFEHARWLRGCAEIEEACGIRSAWYVVPTASRSRPAREQLAWLVDRGHEIGVHGFEHDAGLPEWPEDRLTETLTRSRAALADYLAGPPGYRAPWLSRSETMYRALSAAGYLYDSSAPSADFQRGNRLSNNGCGTLFPFRRAGVLVLPITIPQDSMAACTGRSPQGFWDWAWELVERVKARGGLAVLTTHLQPHHSANAEMEAGYRSLLSRVAEDSDAWLARPRDVAELVGPR